MAELKLLGHLIKTLGKRSGIGEPSVWHAVIVTFMHYFAWGLLTVPFIEKLSRSFGYRVLLVDGLVNGVRGTVAFVSAPIMGSISDSRGRKLVMLLAVASTNLPIPFMMLNGWWCPALYAVSSVFGTTYSASLAYVADVTSLENRSKGYGILAASFVTGIAFSPLLGNFLMDSIGPAAVILIATITWLLNIVFIIFGVPESLVLHEISLVLEETNDNQMLINENLCQRTEDEEEEELNLEQKAFINSKEIETMFNEQAGYHIVKPKVKERIEIGILENKLEKPILELQEDSEKEQTDNNNTNSHLWAVLRESYKDKNLLMIFIISFLSSLPFAGLESTIPIYLKNNMGFEYEEVSLMLGLLSVLGITSNILLGYLVSLVGAKWSIRLGLFCQLSQLLLFAFGIRHWMLWLGSIVAALGTIIHPATISVASIYASPVNLGAVLGMIAGIECLSEGLGPATFGVMFYLFQDEPKNTQTVKSPIPLPFMVSATGIFVAIILTIALKRDTHEKRQKRLYKITNDATEDQNELEPLTKTVQKVGKENASYVKIEFDGNHDGT
ncbi:LOW QUALITY PROTEIN: hippocampus abundant transcript 1 protein-like [Drosophila gunungcola]|uniref:LOW QUALITY PROTEIN: hippocampus abundant transcript 1 protein-like n=1 Tax=Drosophila gunungcola TaxID=103775 RepID=UPI0022E2413E|nr:LOW QUALITY PROTEIN: hippocampus abundant transcript 1 protein-like [Drosophila gunungcola]